MKAKKGALRRRPGSEDAYLGTAAVKAAHWGGAMLNLRTSISALAVVAAATTFASVSPANATEGYAAHGFGARSKALAGAGAADSRDATAAALNPAGLVHVGNEIDMSVSVFSPRRGFETTAPVGGRGFLPEGSFDSDRNYFFIPNLAWSTRAFANPLFDVMAFTVVGNGGMNSSYSDIGPNPYCGGASGLFCDGKLGVNLTQMILSVAMAKQIAPGVSVGIAPMMALQTIDVNGTRAFGMASVDGANIGGGTNDWSYGFGVRGGIEIEPMKGFRIGVSGTSPIWMDDFNHYKGLFANRGEFDIPPSLQAGIAVDVTPQLTLMLDYRRIWFSYSDSIGEPLQNIFGCPAFGGTSSSACFGGSNGPGFGWDDVDVIKFGLEWRRDEKLTLRAGYAWNTNPIGSEDVTLNLIAPAVTQHHITGGFEYDLGGGYHLEMAAMYSPQINVRGPNMFDPGQSIKIDMWQFEGTVGIKYKFDEAAAPLK